MYRCCFLPSSSNCPHPRPKAVNVFGALNPLRTPPLGHPRTPSIHRIFTKLQQLPASFPAFHLFQRTDIAFYNITRMAFASRRSLVSFNIIYLPHESIECVTFGHVFLFVRFITMCQDVVPIKCPAISISK
jgi:hypothetical protein